MNHTVRRAAAAAAAVLAVVVLPALARAAGPGPLQTLTLAVDGVDRTALVYVPPRAAGPTPVVFAFHGHGGTARSAERAFQVDQLWPDAISVYPQGLDTPGVLLDAAGKLPGWQPAVGADGDRDLHLFDALLARLRADHDVDPKRVYCAGHSNGGGFAYVLWRARPDALAAVAVSSAAAGAGAGLKPKPAILLGGRADPLVDFAWQRRTMDAVRRLDGCGPGVPWDGSAAVLYPSAGGTPVVTYAHPGGHAMDRAEAGLIVRFFQTQPPPATRPTTGP